MYCREAPSVVTCSASNRAWTPKTLPVRRWQARRWQIETRTGSPSTVSRSCSQLHAACRVFTIRILGRVLVAQGDFSHGRGRARDAVTVTSSTGRASTLTSRISARPADRGGGSRSEALRPDGGEPIDGLPIAFVRWTSCSARDCEEGRGVVTSANDGERVFASYSPVARVRVSVDFDGLGAAVRETVVAAPANGSTPGAAWREERRRRRDSNPREANEALTAFESATQDLFAGICGSCTSAACLE